VRQVGGIHGRTPRVPHLLPVRHRQADCGPKAQFRSLAEPWADTGLRKVVLATLRVKPAVLWSDPDLPRGTIGSAMGVSPGEAGKTPLTEVDDDVEAASRTIALAWLSHGAAKAYFLCAFVSRLRVILH